MMQGETIRTGAPSKCYECGKELPFRICESAAGFYIGTYCQQDGPHSRESNYYGTREGAQEALDTNTVSWR